MVGGVSLGGLVNALSVLNRFVVRCFMSPLLLVHPFTALSGAAQVVRGLPMVGM